MGVVDQHRKRLPFVDRLETSGDVLHRRDSGGDRLLVQIEEESRRDGSEHVRDVEAATERGLDPDSSGLESAPVSRELECLGPYLRVFGEAERDQRRAMHVGELHREPPTPFVVDAHGRGRWLRTCEEPALRREVLLHRPVQVEVILAQVREDERIEPHPVEASQRRSMGGCFKRDAAVAGVEHLPQEPLQVYRLRCRERRGPALPADHPFDRSDEPWPAAGGLEYRPQEKGGRRLPVRPRHSGDLELLRRLAEERVPRDGHCRSDVVDNELRH